MLLNETMLVAAAALAGLLVVAASALRAWQGWLALKERELSRVCRADPGEGSPSGMARIEIADLKERIRKLEAIASGVDL